MDTALLQWIRDLKISSERSSFISHHKFLDLLVTDLLRGSEHRATNNTWDHVTGELVSTITELHIAGTIVADNSIIIYGHFYFVREFY